jgi:hypothetical protein
LCQREAAVPEERDELDQTLGGIPHLVIKNAGAGPAMNVRGFLWWTGTAGGSAQLHPQMLATGDQAPARVVAEDAAPNWENAVGFLRYRAGNRCIEVIAAGPSSKTGEPIYNATG